MSSGRVRTLNILRYQDPICPITENRGRWQGLTRVGNRLAFSLQAWRKYDTDRSGYIEANELKVRLVALAMV